MISQFVTKTFPNHQSIATGLYEEYHGIINNEFWDPDGKDVFNKANLDHKHFWDEYNVSVPIYMANQFQFPGRASGAMQWPGSIISYGKGVHAPDQNRYYVTKRHDYDHSDWNGRMDEIVHWMTGGDHVNCVFVYFNQPDSTAHQYGPFHANTKAIVKKLDQTLASLLQKLSTAGLHQDQFNLIVLSDHGMSEVRAERRIFLDTCAQPGLSYQIHGVSPDLSLWPVSAPANVLVQVGNDLHLAVQKVLNDCAQSKHGGNFKVSAVKEVERD